ncbi:hypothetical protein F5X68DRAFT_197500, partial [Plectosphaerella plurivora]
MMTPNLTPLLGCSRLGLMVTLMGWCRQFIIANAPKSVLARPGSILRPHTHGHTHTSRERALGRCSHHRFTWHMAVLDFTFHRLPRAEEPLDLIRGTGPRSRHQLGGTPKKNTTKPTTPVHL